MGSSRTDCEQMTGRCVCKQGFQGMKCDICSDKNADETEKCPVNNGNRLLILVICFQFEIILVINSNHSD